MGRRTLWRWSLVLTAALGVTLARAGGTVPEYDVKAAFLFKFATYIRWPARAGALPNTPFVIAVMGRDPFGSALNQVVRGQNVHGRPIVIARLGGTADPRRCDLLFIGSSERARLQSILSMVRGTPVLTVGEMDRFAKQGGMIGLVTEENRVRFEINKAAIDRAGLKASAQLLALARIVDESQSDERER